MVTSPTGKSVIVMGRKTGYEAESHAMYYRIYESMYELTGSLQWNTLEQNIQNDHDNILAIPIPDELVYEKVRVKSKYK